MCAAFRSVAGLLLLGTALVGCTSWGTRSGLPEQLAVGQPAPDIEGTDIDGTPFKLSDYHGQVVLLDFWGNW